MTAQPARTDEFDRFGPWVDQVSTREEVPPLFRDHAFDLDAARLVLKVPRNIARRDAHAAMDLYDHLLVLEERRLVVLSRRFERNGRGEERVRERGFDVRTVELAAVISLRTTVDLLAGSLEIRILAQPPLVIPFNGSARTQVDRLVREIVSLTADAPLGRIGEALASRAGASASAHVRKELAEDKGVAADFLEAASADEALVAVAWHPRQALSPTGRGLAGAWEALSHTVLPATLQAAVVAHTTTTLEVFGRHESIIRRKKPVHSSSRLIVPLAVIDAVSASAHPDYAGVSVVALRSRADATVLVVPSSGAVERLLRS